MVAAHAWLLIAAGRLPAPPARHGLSRPWVWVVVLAICAFIALEALAPTMGGSRKGQNDRAAVSAARTVASAQAAYVSTSGGVFGEMRCLLAPWDCLPDYPRTGPAFLTRPLEEDHRGYRSRLSLSADAKRYAYTLVPAELGKTGDRSFCVDENGTLWVLAEGVLPEVVDAKCPANLTLLQ
jgi:hypothetical protein